MLEQHRWWQREARSERQRQHGNAAAGDLALTSPRSVAETGQTGVVSACPLNTPAFRNTCHILNFVCWVCCNYISF